LPDGRLLLVTQAGQVRVVADDLLFPNGSVITPDGATLIVAETFGKRLTADFDFFARVRRWPGDRSDWRC